MKPLLGLCTYQENVHSARSFYHGPYTKGEFSLSPASHTTRKGSHPSITKINSSHIKNDSNIWKSLLNPTAASTNRSKNVMFSPLNLGKISKDNNKEDALTLTSRLKSPRISTFPDKEINSSKAKDLDGYLNYLSKNTKTEMDSFRSKIVLKRKNPGQALGKKVMTHRPSWLAALDKFVSQEGAIQPEKSPPPSKPAGKLPSINLHTSGSLEELPSFSTLSSPKVGSIMMRTGSRVNAPSPNYMERSVTKRNFYSHYDDHTLAMNLAEETYKNYRIFQENASMTKDSRQIVTKLLKKEGAQDIFGIKTTRQYPMILRIYNDMVENYEVPTPSMKRLNSIQSISFDKKPQFFKPSIKVKLIKDKFEMYKRINAGLEDASLQYKLHNLKRLENTLLKAHQDFKDKKKGVLNRLERQDHEQYHEFKEKCIGFENSIPVGEYDEFGDKIEILELKYGETLKLDGAKKTVNKELDDMMKKWKKAILEAE